MSWILLTNDDGIDSPALVPFARRLAELGEVRVVVPDRERSWVGKAVTRYDPVSARQVVREGIPMWETSGYPADAVQLGIHVLHPEPPDLVVAGINLGYNHGTGFLMSSGTVGAAVEGWISGISAIAFSCGTVGDWHEWRRMIHIPETAPAWDRTALVASRMVLDLRRTGLLGHCDVVSVNMPFDPDPGTPRRLTSVARVGYDRLFREEGAGRFVHEYGGVFLEFEPLDGSDVAAARAGEIAITPLRMPQSAPVPPDVRAALEGSG